MRVESLDSKTLTLAYMKEHLKEFSFTKIMVADSIEESGEKYTLNDPEHPVAVFSGFGRPKYLVIHPDYYKQHKVELDDTIEFICRNIETIIFSLVGKELLTVRNFEAIKNPNNKYLKTVELSSNDKDFLMTLELYDYFKDSQISQVVTDGVCEELQDNYDYLIGYNVRKKLISNYTYVELHSSTPLLTGDIDISTTLSEEEIENFKYIGEKVKLLITSKDYGNYMAIIRRVIELGLSNEIIFSVENKNDFNEEVFSQLNSLNNIGNISIYLSERSEEITIDLLPYIKDDKKLLDFLSYIKYEKRLLDMVSPAMYLSPLEKYLFAYNIVKKFKKYKEAEGDIELSRDLYLILDNEYIVCEGFSVLLGDLLDKLHIENMIYSVDVDSVLDLLPDDTLVLPETVFSPDYQREIDVLTQSVGHSRRMVHIVDPKYGIDGYYIADPTWDNILEEDAYNHALMTTEEHNGSYVYNFMGLDFEELFFVSSIEEFYEKIRIIIDKGKNLSKVVIISNLLEMFKNIDCEFYKEFITRFPDENKWKLQIADIFECIGGHIVAKVNQQVNGQTLKEAIEFLYRNMYGCSEEEIEARVSKIIEYNRARQERVFPTRYKTDPAGNVSVVMNAKNKFDIEDEPGLKNF